MPSCDFRRYSTFFYPLQAIKCCYYSNNGPYFLFRVDYCRFDIWLLFFYLNGDIFLFLFKGRSRVHYLPLVVYPHTNQPQPTATDHQPATATPYTHTITYPIILFHYIITIHDNRYCTRHTFAPIVLYTYIYNIIYLSTILYPISYLKLHTRNYKQASTNATPWYSIPLYLLYIYS